MYKERLKAKNTFIFFACHQIVHEKEIQAEDDQVFLVKLQVREYLCCVNAIWFIACWYSN